MPQILRQTVPFDVAAAIECRGQIQGYINQAHDAGYSFAERELENAARQLTQKIG